MTECKLKRSMLIYIQFKFDQDCITEICQEIIA